jgi:hypothetical protein
MKMRVYRFTLILILTLTLSNCIGWSDPNNKANNSLTPNTPVPKPVATPRWVIYEKALANALLPGSLNALCEWEIWGVSGSQVYVWAQCQEGQSARSIPAVIYLGANGQIEKIIKPGYGVDYAKDIKTLFPPYIQARIFEFQFDGQAAEDHISSRVINHFPPLIAQQNTPLP